MTRKSEGAHEMFLESRWTRDGLVPCPMQQLHWIMASPFLWMCSLISTSDESVERLMFLPVNIQCRRASGVRYENLKEKHLS